MCCWWPPLHLETGVLEACLPCAQRIGCGHSESGLRCLGGGVVMPRVSCMCAQQRLRWQLLTWNTTWNICGRALGSWSCPVPKALILCLYTMQRRGGKTFVCHGCSVWLWARDPAAAAAPAPRPAGGPRVRRASRRTVRASTLTFVDFVGLTSRRRSSMLQSPFIFHTIITHAIPIASWDPRSAVRRSG